MSHVRQGDVVGSRSLTSQRSTIWAILTTKQEYHNHEMASDTPLRW